MQPAIRTEMVAALLWRPQHRLTPRAVAVAPVGCAVVASILHDRVGLHDCTVRYVAKSLLQGDARVAGARSGVAEQVADLVATLDGRVVRLADAPCAEAWRKVTRAPSSKTGMS